MRRWLVAALVGAGFALAAGGALYRKARGTAPTVPFLSAASATSEPDDSLPAWCASGFEPIRGNACFAPASARSAPLIVYLHGRYARDAAAEEVDRQRRLALRANARGFAVLALRGRLGACTAPDLATWYCWPSNGTNADAGSEFVGAWRTALATAQERAGAGQRFLLGFSNGGYFAGLVASRGLLDVDAVVVAHGGPVEPVHALRGNPPLLLLSADEDVAQDEMIRFDEELTRERWAHDSYARGGGHELTDSDIDAALTFFSRAHEPLPLAPPLALHRAVRHVRGPSAEAALAEEDGAQQDDAGPTHGQLAGPGDEEQAEPVAPSNEE